jgi:CRISPR-associated protein Csm4
VKRYEITLKPKSAFGTPLKGDSLFGQFCWQVAYDPGLVSGGIHELTRRYPETPFVVFSSAFPKTSGNKTTYFFPRPVRIIPDNTMADRISRKKTIIGRKEVRSQRWVAVDKGAAVDAQNGKFLSDAEVLKCFCDGLPADMETPIASAGITEFSARFSQPHNSINRLTGTTGEGAFAPYAKENLFYFPGIELSLFVLIDDEATDIDRVTKGVEQIGKLGFGRDASTGLGRFGVSGVDEWLFPKMQPGDAMFTLGPAVPQKQAFKGGIFTPFIRFGKHGDRLATGVNPFKKPIIMADEGAVFKPNDPVLLDNPWIGAAVTGVSYAEPETVAQGYAPWLPVKWGL